MKNSLINYLASVAALLMFALSGCDSDNLNDYLGVWQTSDERPKTIEIRKDGTAYLFDDLRATGFMGQGDAPRVLSVAGKQLVFNTGMGTVPLALNEDRKTMYFDRWILTKVPGSQGGSLKESIIRERRQREEATKTCAAFGAEWKVKSKEVDDSSLPLAEKRRQHTAVDDEFKKRAQGLPGCLVQLMRF